MADLTISIPDAQVQRVADAFGATYGRDPAYAGLTGAALVKAVLLQTIKRVTQGYEAQQAAATAVATVTSIDAS